MTLECAETTALVFGPDSSRFPWPQCSFLMANPGQKESIPTASVELHFNSAEGQRYIWVIVKVKRQPLKYARYTQKDHLSGVEQITSQWSAIVLCLSRSASASPAVLKCLQFVFLPTRKSPHSRASYPAKFVSVDFSGRETPRLDRKLIRSGCGLAPKPQRI